MKTKTQKQFTRFVPSLVLKKINSLEYKRKDDLFCIVDMIYRKTINYKTELQKIYGYVEISNKLFSTLITSNDGLNQALKLLIEEEIIEVNQHYQPGVFCKSYKINSDLLSKKIEVVISDKNINKRIETQEKTKRQWTDKTLEFSKTNYYKNFNIDYEKAYSFIYKEAFTQIKLLSVNSGLQLKDEDIASIINCTGNYKNFRGLILMKGNKELHNILHRFMSQHFKILSIKNGYLYFKRNTTNGRLDTNLTNLPTSLRQFLVSKETLFNIDIKNSQPYFFYSLLKTENAISSEELERYGALVLNGTFYEFLANEYGKLNGKEITRKQAKAMLFKIFFSKTTSFRNVKDFFGSIFPEIMEYIDTHNKNSNAIIANKLSTIESTTIISVILPKLGSLNIKPFTIHDSFVCKESELEAIIEAIKEVTISMYGIAPNLHCKTLIEDSNDDQTIEDMTEEEFWLEMENI